MNAYPPPDHVRTMQQQRPRALGSLAGLLVFLTDVVFAFVLLGPSIDSFQAEAFGTGMYFSKATAAVCILLAALPAAATANVIERIARSGH